MSLPSAIGLRRVIAVRLDIALQGLITAGGVRVEPTARVHCAFGCLLSRLHRDIFGRLEDDGVLPTDLDKKGWPVFVIMASTGLALLAASTRPVPQHLRPTLLGLALLASGVVELLRLDRPCQLTLQFIAQGRIPSPPAPPLTGADMDLHLPGKTMRRTGQAQEEGGKYPVPQCPLTLGHQRVGEVIKGASATVAPVALSSWPVVIHAPVPNIVALAPGTGQWTLLPPQGMEIGVAGVSVEEVVEGGKDRHG